MSGDVILQVDGLVKRLGGKLIVNEVGFSCAAGEVVGLLGPNGAGKTTTLRMCYGFLEPDAGTVKKKAQVLTRLLPVTIREASNASLFVA